MAGNLTENDVHVWYCRCDDPLVDSRQHQYKALLTDDEIARYERFAFEKDRRLFLAARALLRTTLSRYAAVAPKAWRFEQTAKGKLFLPANFRLRPLEFNVSHSGQIAVCAVAVNHAVGVDVESTNRKADEKVAKHFLSPDEMSRFLNAPEEAKAELFYRYWTLKEAYAKALGMGLSIRFTEFTFLLDSEPYPAIVDGLQHGTTVKWHFHQQMIAPHYWLAVAVEHPSDTRPTITVRCQPPQLDDE